MRRCYLGLFAITVLVAAGAHAYGTGTVSHSNVTSDKVEDISSLEAWKRSFIKPGMSEHEKAIAVWRSVVMFRHQDIPPNEFLESEAHVHDPIKSFNVYGYGQCCCASANIEALARYIGLDARGWGITGHSVPEVNVGGRWCMLDASLINYFKKADGSIASVQEISRSITDFYADHPDLRNNNDALYKFMLNGGWKNGPSVVAGGSGYDSNGWLPAATHGWNNTMQEFGDGPRNFPYEYGCALGYEVNIQLRPGERLVRNWSNQGLHVNMLDGEAPGAMSAIVGRDQLRYSPAYGDLAPGRIGNGTVEYNAPLADKNFKDATLLFDNLVSRSEDDAGPAVHVRQPTKPGVLVLRMPSSYIYLNGKVTLRVTVAHGGSVAAFFSDNNGLDWKPIGSFLASGGQIIDLKPFVFRRYDYRLKFVLSGQGTGIDELKITHNIQHSQRALPALDLGTNHIHFTAGTEEGTIVVEGATDPNSKGKNLLFTDFHPRMQNIGSPNLILTSAKGEITVPIETPGEITRLRIGCFYRARDSHDGWTIEASFDGGKTFLAIGPLEGEHAGFSKYLVFEHVPPGRRSTLVRLTGTQRNTTLIFDLRISADYKEPHGGFAPVKITYTWSEGGRARQEVHVVRQPDDTYTIRCERKPLMKSIVMELLQ